MSNGTTNRWAWIAALPPAEVCAGNWGFVCGVPTPDLFNKLGVIRSTPRDVALIGRRRYTDKGNDPNETDIDFKAASYFDVSAIRDATDTTQVRYGGLFMA